MRCIAYAVSSRCTEPITDGFWATFISTLPPSGRSSGNSHPALRKPHCSCRLLQGCAEPRHPARPLWRIHRNAGTRQPVAILDSRCGEESPAANCPVRHYGPELRIDCIDRCVNKRQSTRPAAAPPANSAQRFPPPAPIPPPPPIPLPGPIMPPLAGGSSGRVTPRSFARIFMRS